MVATLVAALLREQAPDHANHRAFDEDVTVVDGKVVVLCSCNVSLTLTVPKAAEPIVIEIDNGKGPRPEDAGKAVIAALESPDGPGKKGGPRAS